MGYPFKGAPFCRPPFRLWQNHQNGTLGRNELEPPFENLKKPELKNIYL